jgi:hypothetical protein
MHRRNWRCGIACRTTSCFSWSSGALWKRRSRRQEQITRDQIGWKTTATFLSARTPTVSANVWATEWGTWRSSARSKSSVRISWYIPYERTNMSPISEMVLHRSSLNFSMNTIHVVDCATCGETIRTLTIFSEVYPRLDWEIHTDRCVFRMALSLNAGLSIWCVSSIVFRSVKANHNENTLFLQINS